MTNLTRQKPALWFWVVSVFALLWNAIGVNQYMHQAYKTDYFYKSYKKNPEIVTIIENSPPWVTAAFATAVIFGVLGCLMLLLRKKWAYVFFFVSLLGLIIQVSYNMFMTDAIKILGNGAVIMPAFLLITGFALLLLSKTAIKKQWIN